MATFINLNLGNPTPSNYTKKHLIYSIIWLLNIAILVFRADAYILNKFNLNNDLLTATIPFSLIIVNFVILFKQKRYYGLVFTFYPIIQIFWFIPKLILEKGKIYLFLYYLGSILKFFSSFKKSLIQAIFLSFVVILLLTTNNSYFKFIGIIYFSYLFFKILYNYIIGSFKKGDSDKNINSRTTLSKIDLIDSLEKRKEDEKLTPEQNESKKIEMMILWNYFLQYISNNVTGPRGKRAFMVLWFFQYFLYFLLTIIFFTFLNFELFKIAPNNFTTKYPPDLFDFFYYTIKTVGFSGIDSLKPFSQIARSIEICSFCILSIYFLIITASSIFSLKMTEYSKDMEEAVDLCRRQNEKIKEHLQTKYNTDISKAISEVETISTATFKLKMVLERIL